MRTIRYLLCVCVIAVTPACAKKATLGPNVTAAGQTAYTADRIINAGKVAVSALTLLNTSGLPGIQPEQLRGVIHTTAGYLEKVGEAGKGLADALDAYRISRSGSDWLTVRGKIVAIRGILNQALGAITDKTIHDAIASIVQPIFDEALALLTAIDPPAVAAAVCGVTATGDLVDTNRCVDALVAADTFAY